MSEEFSKNNLAKSFDLRLPIDRSDNFLFHPSSVDISLSPSVIRFVVDRMCAECVSQGLSARRSNHQADWMNELSFHWPTRCTSYVFVVPPPPLLSQLPSFSLPSRFPSFPFAFVPRSNVRIIFRSQRWLNVDTKFSRVRFICKNIGKKFTLPNVWYWKYNFWNSSLHESKDQWKMGNFVKNIRSSMYLDRKFFRS